MSTGFGTSVYCTDKLRTGRLVRGSTALAQSIFRALSTPPGTLRGGDAEQVFGIDLAGYVGAAGDDVAAASLPSIVSAQIRNDDRVASVSVTPFVTNASAGLVDIELTIDVTPVDEGEDFRMTIGVSAEGVTLLSILTGGLS